MDLDSAGSAGDSVRLTRTLSYDPQAWTPCRVSGRLSTGSPVTVVIAGAGVDAASSLAARRAWLMGGVLELDGVDLASTVVVPVAELTAPVVAEALRRWSLARDRAA